MAREIELPLKQLQNTIPGLTNDEIKKSFSLLSNLIKATLDFAGRSTASVVTEEIPFYLRSEVDLALAKFRAVNPSVSIITKIRNDVPDLLFDAAHVLFFLKMKLLPGRSPQRLRAR